MGVSDLVRTEQNKELVNRSLALAFEEERLPWIGAGLALVYLQDIVWREFNKPGRFEPHDYYYEVMNDPMAIDLLAKRLEYADSATLRLGFFPERFDKAYTTGLRDRVSGIYQAASRELSNGLAFSELATYYCPSVNVLNRFWKNVPEYEKIMLLEEQGGIWVPGPDELQ